MALQILFVLGYLSFGGGLLILYITHRRRLEGFLRMRLWRNYFMPTYLRFNKRRYKNNKHESLLLGAALVLIILGISAMLHVNGIYNAESELNKHESEAGHQLESREIKGIPPPPQKTTYNMVRLGGLAALLFAPFPVETTKLR
jgi:hypothetical protein